jgi:hypothetical protein
MKTAVAISQELDDSAIAASELAAQIRDKLTFLQNSVGVMYCDADADVGELSGLLCKELGMDIVGVTTSATVERNDGYNDMGILLSVLTADDVEFSVGYTEDLSTENFSGLIEYAYTKARAKIADEPKLILTCAPFIPDLTSEHYVEMLDKLSGGTPVFGGVATDHYDFTKQQTFFNGKASPKGLGFILISGNIKPIFSLQHNFGSSVEKKGKITKSSANHIHEVNGQPFKDYVSSIVPVPEDALVIYQFQSTPFVMELPDFETEEQPVVRAILSIDSATGSGSFLSKMPEGSMIYLTEFQRKNLGNSCRLTMEGITKQILAEKDYQYSMLFVCTCNARHLLMAADKSLEGSIINEFLSDMPPELNATGYYGFGEICPTGKRPDGSIKNRFHNISFAVCAI